VPRFAQVTGVLLVLALALVGCGGSSGDSSAEPSGSTSSAGDSSAYTKATNEAASEFVAINAEIAKAAGGGTAAAWTAMADRLDAVTARLHATAPPTDEAKAPLSALEDDMAKLAADARAIADAGGAGSAAAAQVDALTKDSAAVQADLQKLPLY
jgi:hypothetical protein